MSRPEEATRERVETMLKRAVEGSERLGMTDVADRYREMSVEDYASEKDIRLINPVSGSQTLPSRSKPMFEMNPADEFEVVQAGENEINPETHDYESERPELMGKSKPELVDEILVWRECGDRIWHAPAAELADAVVEELNEVDPDRYPVDEEEEQQDEAA